MRGPPRHLRRAQTITMLLFLFSPASKLQEHCHHHHDLLYPLHNKYQRLLIDTNIQQNPL